MRIIFTLRCVLVIFAIVGSIILIAAVVHVQQMLSPTLSTVVQQHQSHHHHHRHHDDNNNIIKNTNEASRRRPHAFSPTRQHLESTEDDDNPAAVSSDDEDDEFDNIAGKSYGKTVGDEPIDAVYTWVNGSDPLHAKARLRFLLGRGEGGSAKTTTTEAAAAAAEMTINVSVNNGTQQQRYHSNEEEEGEDDDDDRAASNRFEDHDELLYSLRGLQRYAGWVRRVYIVTNGQVPSWLLVDLPGGGKKDDKNGHGDWRQQRRRIRVISHLEIFPNTSHLPVFSSSSIESHIHRIPGLSRRFLYLNDDTFFGAPVLPDDFLCPVAGHKIFLSWPVPNCAEGCQPGWINDNYCDKACNNSECDFDGGDCLRPNSISTSVDDNRASSSSSLADDKACARGCADSWIGDRFCDIACNVASCGFDAGDCGMDRIVSEIAASFPSSHISPDDAPSSSSSSSRSGGAAGMAETPLTLVELSLNGHNSNDTSTATGQQHHSNHSSNTLEDLVFGSYDSDSAGGDGGKKNRSSVFVATVFPNVLVAQKKEKKTAASSDDDHSHQQHTIAMYVNMSSFFFERRAEVLLLSHRRNKKKNREPATITTGAAAAPLSRLRSAWFQNTDGCDRVRTSTYLQSSASFIATLLLRRRNQNDNNNNTCHHNCDYCLILFDFSSPAGGDGDGDGDDINKFILNISFREGEGEGEEEVLSMPSSSSSFSSPQPTTLFVRRIISMGVADLNSTNSSSTFDDKVNDDVHDDVPVDDTRQDRVLLDTFGDSLRFSNKLLNSKFGTSSTARRAPAHMVHLIDRYVVDRLSKVFHVAWDRTSAARFRTSDALQYGFMHMYYIMHAQREPSHEEFFSTQLDMDGSGVLEDYELRRVALLLYEKNVPLEKILENIVGYENRSLEQSTSNDDSVTNETSSDSRTRSISSSASSSSSSSSLLLPSSQQQRRRRRRRRRRVNNANDRIANAAAEDDDNDGDTRVLLPEEQVVPMSDEYFDAVMQLVEQAKTGLKLYLCPVKIDVDTTTTANSSSSSSSSVLLDQTLFRDSHLANLTVGLYADQEFKYELQTLDDVTFFMIRNNATLVRHQMDHILWKRPKFFCVNDNMNRTRSKSFRKVQTLFRDFMKMYFPHPSAFERRPQQNQQQEKSAPRYVWQTSAFGNDRQRALARALQHGYTLEEFEKDPNRFSLDNRLIGVGGSADDDDDDGTFSFSSSSFASSSSVVDEQSSSSSSSSFAAADYRQKSHNNILVAWQQQEKLLFVVVGWSLLLVLLVVMFVAGKV